MKRTEKSRLGHIVLFYFLLQGCNIQTLPAEQERYNLKSITISWNKATSDFLFQQARSDTDASEYWKNRADVLYDSEYSKDPDSTNYRFSILKLLAERNLLSSTRYIIEADMSGLLNIPRIIVIYQDPNSKLLVKQSFYSGFPWHAGRVESVKIEDNEFVNDRRLFGQGRNRDDLIVTEFSKGRIVYSEYFLVSTLASESKLNEITVYPELKNL